MMPSIHSDQAGGNQPVFRRRPGLPRACQGLTRCPDKPDAYPDPQTMPNFPKELYEPLPYLYVGVGLATTFGLETLLGRISGIMLVGAGLIIGYQRYTYRRQLRIRQEREAWLKTEAERRKREKQAWLRNQAQKYRDALAQKDEDF